jgi:catechol 2,3-dioxygenase-like lactoylglutathione lyase family enzyme
MQFCPHISLDIADLDASVHFYSAVFATKSMKQRGDYANFRLEELPLHLALVSQSADMLAHLQISTLISSYL